MPEWLKSSNQPVRSTAYGRWKAHCGVWPLQRLEPRSANEPVALACRCKSPGLVVTSRNGKIDLASSIRSLSLPGAATRVDEVAERRRRVAGERAAARRARARSFGVTGRGLVDQRVEVVERRAQVHERRVGAAHERRAARRSRSAASPSRRAIASKVVGQAVDELDDVVAALGDVGDELGVRRRRSCSSARSVVAELLEQPARRDQRRVEVLPAGVGLGATCPRRSSPKPRMTFCRPLRVFSSKRLKSWSRSTAVVVSCERDQPAVGDRLLRLAGRQLQVDVAVGHARQRCDADRGLRCRARSGARLVVDLELDLGRAVVGELDRLDQRRRGGRRSARGCP